MPPPNPLPITGKLSSIVAIIGSTGNTYMPSHKYLAFGVVSTNFSMKFIVHLSKNRYRGDIIIY